MANLRPTPIQESFRFKLKNPKYPNGDPIVKAYVNHTCARQVALRPLKQNGEVQPVQIVTVSPFIIGTISGRGKVIHFDSEGKSFQFEDYMLRNAIRVFCDFN